MKIDLPNRWAIKHDAYYYRVPRSQVPLWGKQWFRLGKTYEESIQTYKEKLVEIAKSSVCEADLADPASLQSAMFPATGPIVYFLFKGLHLVYIGKTRSIFARLSAHTSNPSVDFDAVTWISCAEDELDTLEVAYIAKYSPPLNSRIAESGNGSIYFPGGL